MTKPEISVVVPVFGCEECLEELHEKLVDTLASLGVSYEIIFVDDRAKDNAWDVITRLGANNPQLKALRLSRNFGQHAAITAGLANAKGEWAVIIDCDLQDDPAYIANLYKKAKEGFDIVFTRKIKRQHSFFKNVTAKIYSWLFNYLADSVKSFEEVGAYSIISRPVINEFLGIRDQHRHYLLILRWLGFDYSFIDIDHQKRHAGKSSYNLSRLFMHALDGITSQSTKLLRISIGFGVIFAILSMFGIASLVMLYFLQGFREGWASTMVLILLSTGLILISVGITGIYVGNIFDQSRDRPIFIVQKRLNFPADGNDDV